jgi:hypothetical protein
MEGGSMKNYIWVVEASFDRGNFKPTVGVGLNKEDGRKELAEWKNRNPSEKFQLVKYVKEAENER